MHYRSRMQHFFYCLIGIAGLWTMGGFAAEMESQLPHLDLEMTSQEYRQLTAIFLENKGDEPFTAILDAGQRNLDWIDVINQGRSIGSALQLSSAETQIPIPIDQPSIASRTIIWTEWTGLLAAMPTAMQSVLIDGDDLTSNPPVADAVFLSHARILDRVYQRASRWLLQEPRLRSHAAAAYRDVRGFYHLTREPELEQKLRGWGNLTEVDRRRLSGHLVSLCANSKVSLAICKDRLTTALRRDGHAWGFYAQYLPVGQQVWDSFFRFSGTRTDITWSSSNPNILRIPFLDPGRDAVREWLTENIQDEWRWLDWRLNLDFRQAGGVTMTHVVFEDGAQPRVRGTGNSEILMDGNRNLTEYTSRWLIRHEYGHVLGFPDCYVEFFDATDEVMVNYQLDTTDLMCSRLGRLKERHYQQLRNAYFR